MFCGVSEVETIRTKTPRQGEQTVFEEMKEAECDCSIGCVQGEAREIH